MKALIHVGYGCNDRCLLCPTAGRRLGGDEDAAGEAVEGKIEAAARLGFSMVVLAGGEPTIRGELLRWARAAAERGVEVGLVTNGRMLSYPGLVERLLRFRLGYVRVRLHGPDAAVHARASRSDGFEQSLAGLAACSGRGIDLHVDCLVTRANVDRLAEMVDLLAPLPDVRLNFAAVDAAVCAEIEARPELFAELVPAISHVGARFDEAWQHASARDMGWRVTCSGIPWCLISRPHDRAGGPSTHGITGVSHVGDLGFRAPAGGAFVHAAPCRLCSLRGACPGLPGSYVEGVGGEELRPIVEPCSNSFNYTPFDELRWTPGAPCPLLARGPARYDRRSMLFVRDADQVRLCEMRSRDFGGAQLLHIKEELQQVYVDLTDKLAPDDFPEDLRRLRRLATCRTCPALAVCPSCYEPIPRGDISWDARPVREAIEGLRGDVLDIGCGDAPYKRELLRLVDAGHIRYTGIEPDAALVARLRQVLPEAELITARAEDTDLGASRYDHVLMLRSFNHLADPRRVLAAAARAVRPGGTLLVVDNVAFGLVRDSGHADRAESGPAVFEHYRNSGAEDAACLADGLPLELIACGDVGPETTNEWHLHFRKVGAA